MERHTSTNESYRLLNQTIRDDQDSGVAPVSVLVLEVDQHWDSSIHQMCCKKELNGATGSVFSSMVLLGPVDPHNLRQPDIQNRCIRGYPCIDIRPKLEEDSEIGLFCGWVKSVGIFPS